jgi:hypothetical protein
MVDDGADPYVRRMAPKTLRLAHPELCDACAALLPVGTVVLVDPSLHVSCAHCAEELPRLRAVDPWAFVSDVDLHDRLVHRHEDTRQLVSA